MIELAAPRSKKTYPDQAIDCQEMLDVDFNRMMTDAPISEKEMERTLLAGGIKAGWSDHELKLAFVALRFYRKLEKTGIDAVAERPPCRQSLAMTGIGRC
jgi:hypothetical protein